MRKPKPKRCVRCRRAADKFARRAARAEFRQIYRVNGRRATAQEFYLALACCEVCGC